MNYWTESTVEDTTLSWLEDLGYEVLFGPNIAFDGPRLAQLCAAFGVDFESEFTSIFLKSDEEATV